MGCTKYFLAFDSLNPNINSMRSYFYYHQVIEEKIEVQGYEVKFPRSCNSVSGPELDLKRKLLNPF